MKPFEPGSAGCCYSGNAGTADSATGLLGSFFSALLLPLAKAGQEVSALSGVSHWIGATVAALQRSGLTFGP